jgi:hypothetical protein
MVHITNLVSNHVAKRKLNDFRGKADHILSLACFCHIAAACSCAGLQIPNLDISPGIQMSVRTVQLALSQMLTAAALLVSKPVHMKTLGMNPQLTCPVQFSVMRNSSVSSSSTMALFIPIPTHFKRCLFTLAATFEEQ